MFKRLLLALVLSLIGTSAWAQNPQCPTRPPGDSSNACANTAFVTAAVGTLPTPTNPFLFSQLSPGGSAAGFAPLALYQEIFPGVTSFDTVDSALDIPASSAIINQAAWGAYVRNRSGGNGTIGNGVGFFAAVTAETNSTATWGANLLCQTSSSRVVGSGTGRVCIGVESDMNAMNAGDDVFGFEASGNSLAQPALAIAYETFPLGTGFTWTYAYKTEDAAAIAATSFGSLASTANSLGQPSYYHWRNSSAVDETISLQASGGFFIVAGSTGFAGFDVSGGSLYLSQGFSIVGNGKLLIGTDGSNDTVVGNAAQTTVVSSLTTQGATCNSSGGALSSSATGPCPGQTIPTSALTTGTSGSSPTAGQLGETITNTGSAGVSIGNNTVVTLATVTLSAGDWNCSGQTQITFGVSTVATSNNIGITSTPVSFPAFPAGIVDTYAAATTSASVPNVFPYYIETVIVRPTTSTSYSLVVQIAHSAGTVTGQGYLQCVRQD